MEIVADWSQVQPLEARLVRVPGAMPKALERALNRTGQGLAALTSQGVRAQYTTTARAIKERLYTSKASARRGVYEVRTDPRREGYQRLSLMHFAGVRPKEMPGSGKARPPKGIRVRVRKDRGGYLPHSFVAPMRNSRTGGDTGLGIFQRKGKQRTPIRKMTGPPVASQMKNTGVRERVVPEAQRRLDARLVHEARHVLRQAGLLP
ncbi:MAG: phage tail protein [Desulfarculus sp.]|nr:phage tail protein [Desulfarculus sp.]